MLTFNQIYTEVQAQAQDTDATSLTVIKQAINQGMRKFANTLNREWRIREKTFSTVADQQWYQAPEDLIRLKSMFITVGSVAYPLVEIVNEEDWRILNMRTQSSSVPEYFYVKGSDQFGIYPIPDGANTGTISYEPSMRDMVAADYTTGTVTMTLDSAAVVGASTIWTANMVGRVLFITDGSADGMGYKLSSFTDTTHIGVENYYGGTTGAGKTYLIGEVPDIPEEYHEALVDYGLFRYYRRRRDLQTAKVFEDTFKEALQDCQNNYSSKTVSQYFRRPPFVSGGYRQYSNVNRSITP